MSEALGIVKDRTHALFMDGICLREACIETGADYHQALQWSRAERWRFYKQVAPIERRWKDRLRIALEAMSEAAETIGKGLTAVEIARAPVGQRILALKLLVDSMEKSARMLGETPDAGASQPNVPMIMERGKAIEVLAAMGYKPPCGLPAPIDAVEVKSSADLSGVAERGLKIDSRVNQEGAVDE